MFVLGRERCGGQAINNNNHHLKKDTVCVQTHPYTNKNQKHTNTCAHTLNCEHVNYSKQSSKITIQKGIVIGAILCVDGP